MEIVRYLFSITFFLISTFSVATEYLLQGKYSGQLLTGNSQYFLIQENEKSIFEVEGFGLDIYVKISATNKEWKLASWRGTSGRVRFALTKAEAKYTKLIISTTDKIGPEGEFSIKKVVDFTAAVWQAERDIMNGLNIHYRHYLKEEVDRNDAIPLMQKGLDYWFSENKPSEIARVSYELAAVYRGLSNLDIAYKNYSIAKTNWLELNDLNAAATAANVMGLIDRSRGEYDSALRHFGDAKIWRESLDLKQPAAISSNNMALVHLDRGNFQKAIEMFKQALIGYGWDKQVNINFDTINNDSFIADIAAIGDIKRATLMFNNLALAYDKNGSHFKAINIWKKSLLLSQHISAQASIGIIQNNIGRAYYDRGLINKAHKYLLNSHRILISTKDKKYLAMVKYNLAELLFFTGKYEDSLDYYNSSKELRESYNDYNGFYDTILAQGRVYKNLERFKLSSDYLYQAELGFKKLGLKGKQGLVLFELSDLFYLNDKYVTAKRLVNKSIILLNTNGTKRDQARAYLLLGNIELSLNNYKKSLPSYEIALNIAENNNDQLLVPKIMSKLSLNYEKLGNIDLALTIANNSVAKFDRLNQQFNISSDIASFAESYYSAVIHLSELTIKQGDEENALLIFDKARSRTFGKWSYQLEDNTYIERKLNEISLLEEQKESLKFNKNKSNKIQIIEKKIRLIYHELEGITESNSDISESLSALPQIKQETLVIQYMLANPVSKAFVINNDGVKSFTISGKSEIEKNVNNLHVSLKSQNKKLWLKSSKFLESILFPKDLQLNNYNNLVIIADGALQTLPFAALKNNNKYIIEQIELSFAPSLKAYTLLNNSNADNPINITVYADPVYQKNDNRYLHNQIKIISSNFKKIVTLFRSADNLTRLYGAEYETQLINSLAENNVTLKTGFLANKKEIISNKDNASVLHFAAHSIPNEKMSGLSSIELSRFDEFGKKVNSSLRAIDIAGLKGVLSPKLVVLSACETSLGQFIRGEGYLGLTRAFLEIGTQNVVSTLWKIDDKTTAKLMQIFYQELIKGKTVTASLQTAQNTIRKTKPNPFYWAGFVSHGNPNLSFKPILDNL